MARRSVSRRMFLALAAGAGVAAVSGCAPKSSEPVVVFKRSGRGGHVSNAAKKHNANHLYGDAAVAAHDLAHPGDRSRVVSLTISRQEFDRLFANGRQTVDLRSI